MRTFRITLVCGLVLTLLLVKTHLGSIKSDRVDHQDHQDRRKFDFVVNDGGAHIELVSKDQLRPPVQAWSSSTVTSTTTVSTSTSKIYPEPTNPAIKRTEFKPQIIPVEVPGLWYDDYDDLDDPWWQFLGNEEKEERKATPSSPPKPKVTPKTDRIIVMGRTSWEDSDWLEEELPEWQHAVYVVDDPDAEYSVKENKGKESNAYLQYIIDHYDKLPNYMVFIHAHRASYHVEFMEQDNALTIQRLQLDYVDESGYVNLRCDWNPGCPNEVQPFRQLAGRTTEIAFAGAWMQIFNNTNIPEYVAAPCCAQFAVSRAQVLARPLSDYQAYHNWLMTTELDDETSGRVFEYLWHIIFGKEAVYCPSKAQCYNDVYNIEYDPEWDWSLPQDEWLGEDSLWGEDSLDQKEELNDEEENDHQKGISSSLPEDDTYAMHGNSSEADEAQILDNVSLNS
ncbi:hypothetical protein N7523_008442 [Penicillium sp. IBT 18751x]|nr:hypothetical protein N7523_008442 [Penicillium sp. IBT 18751x]